MDADAIEIGKLYRKAKEATEGGVTGTQNFSEKISTSRNATAKANKDKRPPARGCAWCEAHFAPGQTRFPIIVDWFGDYFASGFRMRAIVASLCLDCFKDAYDTAGEESGARVPRINSVCAGCGEPIQTIQNPRCRHWLYCSNRCYQRDYRKRRRGQNSVVDWKGRRTHSNCLVCKKQIDQWGKQHKRKDRLFCSGKCRQWAYRRRKTRP
jgi:hypothetical protein